MQTCSACGHENPDGQKFCGDCAAPLQATAEPRERRKLATLLFCDMSGSTALGERVDAESVQELLRSYFGEMRAAVEGHGGSVEKFIGDAVVAGFGVHEVHEDDALRACRSALEMQARLVGLNADLERRFGTSIAVRIGVNTGEVVTGGAMSAETFVTGDAVNVAARLEQAAGPGEVLLGEPTYRLVRDSVTVEAVEPLTVKGKSAPLAAYRLLGVSSLRPTPRGAATALVGRTRELELLEQELKTAVAEQCCRLVTVVGEPGVGKSRLAAELIERARGARSVRGACLSYGEGITFWAIGQIVSDLAGIRDEHSVAEARAQLDGVLESVENGQAVSARIAQLLGLAEGTTTADEMTHAIGLFLAAAASDRPLVLLVDDIHWAEPALLDLIAALPALIEDTPVFLLCLARPELREHRPEWPVTARLEPLNEADVDAMLDNLIGGAPAAVRIRLAQIAAGNPLYAEELVEMLVDEGVLRRDEHGSWVLERELDQVDLPVSLNALLGARLDRLDAEARNALERGAVEGELFHRGAVVELSPETSRPAVPGELDELTGKDMIRPAAPSFAGEVAYRFKHILVRETAYRATAKKLRASLHEHFADWLERLVGERMGEHEEILGYHLEQAHRYREELGPVDDDARALAARAARHLGASGRRANDRDDVRAGANLLGRALALLPAESHQRLELLLDYAYALNSSGRLSEGLGILNEAYEQATTRGERRIAARALVSRINVEIGADPNVDLKWARAMTEDAIEIYTELGDEADLANGKRLLGFIYRIQSQCAEATAWFERALVHANACDEPVTRRRITQSLAMVLCAGPMPAEEAIRRCGELLDANHDNRVLEAVIMRCLAALLTMAGRFDDARKYERKAGPVLDEANTMGSWLTEGIAAETKAFAGDRAGAERQLETKWRSHQGAIGEEPEAHAMSAAYRLAHLYCDDGRWDEVERCLAYGSDALLDGSRDSDRLAAEARLAAHRGRFAEAVVLAQRALDASEPTDNLNFRARIWLALAEVQRAAGDTAEADAAVAKALELYEQKGNAAAAEGLRVGAVNA